MKKNWAYFTLAATAALIVVAILAPESQPYSVVGAILTAVASGVFAKWGS